jgi:transcriptional regulator with XRE-family HTH domain
MAAKKKVALTDPEADEPVAVDDDYPLELLDFGKRLERELRRKLGAAYSQSEVARRTGVSQPTIYNLTKKKNRKFFRLSTVLKIAKALEISLDVLLLDRPDPWKIVANSRRTGGARIAEHPALPAPESPPRLLKKRVPRT